jgi:uncharacterized protein (DUF4415 family)
VMRGGSVSAPMCSSICPMSPLCVMKSNWAAVDASPLSAIPDADSPALTRTQAAQLRPLGKVLPAFSTGKTRITINLDDTVLQAYKARAGGRGYQTPINETLREAMRGVQLADLVRNVIREELHTS